MVLLIYIQAVHKSSAWKITDILIHCRAEFTRGRRGQVPRGPPAQGAPLKSKNNAKSWEKIGNKEKKKTEKKSDRPTNQLK